MAKTRIVQLNISTYGDGDDKSHTSTYSNTASSGQDENRAFATGDNTMTKPTAATKGLAIGNISGTLKVKGNAGDTGVTLDANFEHVFYFTTTLIINASASATADIRWI